LLLRLFTTQALCHLEGEVVRASCRRAIDLHRLLRQYLYFCTSKSSKLRTCTAPACSASEMPLLLRLFTTHITTQALYYSYYYSGSLLLALLHRLFNTHITTQALYYQTAYLHCPRLQRVRDAHSSIDVLSEYRSLQPQRRAVGKLNGLAAALASVFVLLY
jgi:hypothetical protein